MGRFGGVVNLADCSLSLRVSGTRRCFTAACVGNPRPTRGLLRLKHARLHMCLFSAHMPTDKLSPPGNQGVWVVRPGVVGRQVGGIKRFESDHRANRKRLRELTEQQAAAQTLLDIDEQIANHRFLELRHQLTHSLAPILAWQSLLWFEVAEIDEKGGVIAYSSRHLTPSERIQGDTPPDQLYARTIADGREVIDLIRRAMLALAELLTVAGKLEPPPLLWRVMQTGEVFFDRAEASRAARATSGYVSPFDLS
jgi:hypothetical protein